MRPARLLHLVARRGNALELPENTVPALRSAMELGARFIEMDVQLSADCVPMVIRDHELARTTGAGGCVSEYPAARLARIDAGEAERFNGRFSDIRIPKLSEALALLDHRPEVTAFIAIGRASLARFGVEPTVAQIVAVVRPFRSRCVIVSADLPAVHRARRMAGCAVGWLLPSYDAHTHLKCEALQPDYLLCDRSHLPPVGSLWRGPWKWVLYEVMQLEVALQLAERGADFIGTRHVRAMSEAMRDHAARHRRGVASSGDLQ